MICDGVVDTVGVTLLSVNNDCVIHSFGNITVVSSRTVVTGMFERDGGLNVCRLLVIEPALVLELLLIG